MTKSSITLLVLTVILAAHINAYPQDAEIIPQYVPRKSSADLDLSAAHGRSFIPPPEFFMRMFGDDYFYPPFHPARFIPPVPFYPIVPPPGVVPMVPFPDLSKLPDNYSNSTREVKTVNGQTIVINQKIDKTKDGNGFFVSHFQTYHSTPDEQVHSGSTPNKEVYPTSDDRGRSTPNKEVYPATDEKVNSITDESHSRDSSDVDVPLVRKRRDIIGGLFQQLFKIIFTVPEYSAKALKKNEKLVVSSVPAEKLESSKQVSSRNSNEPVLRSLEGDVRINFGKSIHKINVDAEMIGTKKEVNTKKHKIK